MTNYQLTDQRHFGPFAYDGRVRSFDVYTEQYNVMLQIIEGNQVGWVELSPEEAMGLAHALCESANQADQNILESDPS